MSDQNSGGADSLQFSDWGLVGAALALLLAPQSARKPAPRLETKALS